MKSSQVVPRRLLVAAALASALLLGGWLRPPDACAVGDKSPVKAPLKLPPDLALVGAEGAGFLTIRAAEVWSTDFAKELLQKLAKAKPDLLREITKHVGLEITQVERVTMILPDKLREEPLVAVTTTKPLPRDKVLQALLKDYEEKEWGGKTCYVAKRRYGGAICFLTDRVFVVASTAHLEEVLTRKPSGKDKGALTSLVRLAAGKPTLVAGFNLEAPFFQEMGKRSIGEWTFLRTILSAKPGVLTAIGNSKTEVELRLSFAGKKQAEEAEEALTQALKLCRAELARGRQELDRDAKRKRRDELQRWLFQKAGGFLNKVDKGMAKASVRRQGSELTASMTVDAPAAEGILMTALWSFMPSPPKEPPRGGPEPEPRSKDKPLQR